MGQLSGMCVLAEFLNPSFSHRLGRSFTIILSDIVLLLGLSLSSLVIRGDEIERWLCWLLFKTSQSLLVMPWVILNKAEWCWLAQNNHNLRFSNQKRKRAERPSVPSRAA